MLALFDKSVAKSPEGLTSPHLDGISVKKDNTLIDHFSSTSHSTITINLGVAGFMAYTNEKQSLLLPRLFAVVDDIFCLFQGHIENIPLLKRQYGLNKTANEVTIVMEAYRTLRDRGPYPAVQDADGSVPFYWGTDSEGHLVLSDDVKIIKMGCGKSFAPFPKGCFFTSSGELRSFEHPLNELKPMPRVDSQGQVCGPSFKVDSETRKDSNIPRVGSAANWSSQF